MGCDIHIYTEKKKSINGKDEWVNCDNWKLNPYFIDGNDEGASKFSINEVYGNRNYNLFSVLAGVRNYHENKYICEPRGLPEDVSDIVKAESDSWDCVGHSHSYFTLAELKVFKKENNIQKYAGLMSPENAEKVDAGEMPESWCQGTNIKTYVRREWQREGSPLDDLIKELDQRLKEEFWVYNEKDIVEAESKFRIVFWFDN